MDLLNNTEIHAVVSMPEPTVLLLLCKKVNVQYAKMITSHSLMADNIVPHLPSTLYHKHKDSHSDSGNAQNFRGLLLWRHTAKTQKLRN